MTDFDYSKYAPKVFMMEKLGAATEKITSSGILLKLGWVGAIIQLIAVCAFFWFWKTCKDEKLLVDEQIHRVETDISDRERTIESDPDWREGA